MIFATQNLPIQNPFPFSADALLSSPKRTIRYQANLYTRADPLLYFIHSEFFLPLIFMCGRFFCLFEDSKTLLEAAQVACQTADFEVEIDEFFNYKGPNYNVCPTQRIPVLNADGKLSLLPWGFHVGPVFVVNARSDEIYEKKTFKDIIDHERCVVISSGYYEWHESKSTSKKEAYSFRPRDQEICFLAALRHPSSGSVVLVTREASEKLKSIHSRMPLILRPESLKDWLDPTITFRSISKALIDEEDYTGKRKDHCGSLIIDAVALAPHVNSIKNAGPECLQTLKDYKDELFNNGIGRFFSKKPRIAENGSKASKQIIPVLFLLFNSYFELVLEH